MPMAVLLLASVTTCDNIVLAVMSTFRYLSYDKETDLVTMGPGCQLAGWGDV